MTAAAFPTVGRLERLPKWLNLIPMILQWLWLSMRYRSLSLPSTANPAIPAGGLVGEGKLDYFATMGSHALAATARFVGMVHLGPDSAALARAAMAEAGLNYPLIVKPDIGWCGFGVRLVANDGELAAYLSRFPRGERLLLQRFLPLVGEAGLYFARRPGPRRGRLIGVLLRHFPRVVGDGRRSIRQLMADDPRLGRLGRDGLSEPLCDIAIIPKAGQVVRLSTIGSTRVGGLYQDATAMITEAMTDAVDAIARDMTEFHVGRFDIRYDSLAALAQGLGFTIFEVNGAGSEAVHAWDPKFSLREAYAIVFEKQRLLFEVGDAMRRRGNPPIKLAMLARLHLRQQQLIKRYPLSN